MSTNRLSISDTLDWLLSFLEIVAIGRVVVVDVGLILTTGPTAIITRVTEMILLIHEVSSRMEEGLDVERGD